MEKIMEQIAVSRSIAEKTFKKMIELQAVINYSVDVRQVNEQFTRVKAEYDLLKSQLAHLYYVCYNNVIKFNNNYDV